MPRHPRGRPEASSLAASQLRGCMTASSHATSMTTNQTSSAASRLHSRLAKQGNAHFWKRYTSWYAALPPLAVRFRSSTQPARDRHRALRTCVLRVVPVAISGCRNLAAAVTSGHVASRGLPAHVCVCVCVCVRACVCVCVCVCVCASHFSVCCYTASVQTPRAGTSKVFRPNAHRRNHPADNVVCARACAQPHMGVVEVSRPRGKLPPPLQVVGAASAK